MDLKEKKAGALSEELKQALGMTSELIPPPWLVNMQRYGPPPSYPTLRIPGLNAPIPPGAAYGFHAGGWGKPPVDEYGRPIYGNYTVSFLSAFEIFVGDVFGVYEDRAAPEEQVDKEYRWGAIAAAESSDEEEEEEVGEETYQYTTDGTATPATAEGINSIVSGMETPDTIDLRKRVGIETPDAETAKELFQVIQEKQAHATGQLFGSDRQYVLSGAESEIPKAAEEVGEKRKKTKAEAEADSSAAKKLKDFKF